MFEEEAEEYAEKHAFRIPYDGSNNFYDDKDYECSKEGFQKGAEFGCNKANEWHYPSKGEYPKENKRYLCKVKAFVGGSITYECFDYDTEYSSWKGASGDVIAWKEIVLPKGVGE